MPTSSISSATSTQASVASSQASTSSSTSSKKTTKTSSNMSVSEMATKIADINTSEKEVDTYITKLSKQDLSPAEEITVQRALQKRQKKTDMLSNFARTMHEMSMTVVRNLKLQ